MTERTEPHAMTDDQRDQPLVAAEDRHDQSHDTAEDWDDHPRAMNKTQVSGRTEPNPSTREATGKTREATGEAREAAGDIGRRGMRQGVVAGTRFMAAIPSVGLLVAAVTLTIRTLVDVVNTTGGVLTGHIDMQTMLVEYIECADFFLLSIVMYIMAVGLYSLFIDPDVDMPGWLEIRDLDDLKEKLVGVIVVVMGVYFLGQLIHGTNTLDLLRMGLAIGAVVLSLAYFVHHVIAGRHEH